MTGLGATGSATDGPAKSADRTIADPPAGDGAGSPCPIAVMARMRDGSHGIAHRELGGFGHDSRPAILPRREVVGDDSAHGLIWRLENECAGGVFIIGLHDPFCTHPRLG